MSNTHNALNYIELPSTNNVEMKAFYGKAFRWTFQDWGETYVAIHGAGVEGGFDQASGDRQPSNQGALVILYSEDLKASEMAVRDAGGEISVPPYSFPGGQRFHFTDPSGNELAIWTPSED